MIRGAQQLPRVMGKQRNLVKLTDITAIFTLWPDRCAGVRSILTTKHVEGHVGWRCQSYPQTPVAEQLKADLRRSLRRCANRASDVTSVGTPNIVRMLRRRATSFSASFRLILCYPHTCFERHIHLVDRRKHARADRNAPSGRRGTLLIGLGVGIGHRLERHPSRSAGIDVRAH